MSSIISFLSPNTSSPRNPPMTLPSLLSPSFLPSPLPLSLLIPLIPLYLLLVHMLRHRRSTTLKTQLSPPPSSTTSSTTKPSLPPQTAQTLNLALATLEFPFTYEKALQFALFRTYGIPSISSLLLHTTHLSSPKTSAKRYVDTEVLIQEFVSAPTWGSDRWVQSVARMNMLHAQYMGGGRQEEEEGGKLRISNEDLLYTLSLFALEPLRWIGRWEWRGITELEREAVGGVWRRVGEAMHIDYAALERSGEWESGTQWLEDVEAWAEAYEGEKMVYV